MLLQVYKGSLFRPDRETLDDLVVLPRAASLINAGMNPDHSILSMQIMHHRLSARPSNVVTFPQRPDSTAV